MTLKRRKEVRKEWGKRRKKYINARGNESKIYIKKSRKRVGKSGE
jgi:hypothetical protein